MITIDTHMVSLRFRGCPNGRRFVFPVSQETANAVQSYFEVAEFHPRMIRFNSRLGHRILLNLTTLLHAECYETNYCIPFDLKSITPSDVARRNFKCADERQAWRPTVWIQGVEAPVDLVFISYAEWDRIERRIDTEHRFLNTTDGHGEHVAIPFSDINLIVGFEFERYTEQQVELLSEPIYLMETNA
jgi:hypothetical protein